MYCVRSAQESGLVAHYTFIRGGSGSVPQSDALFLKCLADHCLSSKKHATAVNALGSGAIKAAGRISFLPITSMTTRTSPESARLVACLGYHPGSISVSVPGKVPVLLDPVCVLMNDRPGTNKSDSAIQWYPCPFGTPPCLRSGYVIRALHDCFDFWSTSR